jgi:plasmid stabilization system protein ParE
LTEIIWSLRALREHRNIVERLEDLNPAAARRIGDAIIIKVAELGSMPKIGRPGRLADTRELVITRTPYIVVYELAEGRDRVDILRVIHGAMRWPPR